MKMRILVAFAIVLLAACASSPPSHFYTLTGPAAPAARGSGLSLVVGPVAIPAAVDRPEIVVTVGENEVWIDEFNRWVAPLADGIGLATAANLGAELMTQQATLLSQ